jgi:hypothetical protein
LKLLITTQVYENYGAHDWDGKNECPQYWKAKGGDEYVVKNFQGGQGDAATTALMLLRDQIEKDTPYYREQIIDWKIVKDDYLTEYEQSQLEYEGKITFPAKELVWA